MFPGDDYYKDTPRGMEVKLSLIPIYGIIFYFAEKDTRPGAAITCLIISIVSFIVGLIILLTI